MNRRLVHLDLLRGVAVVCMIEAHVLDAWTGPDERGGLGYAAAMVAGGLGAPLFMFLAGVTLALNATSRQARGAARAEVAAMARRRGWQIVGLAFLFRLQSWLISGGEPSRTLLKVDVLNIMGLSMLAAGLLWGLGRSRRARGLLFGGGAVAVVALTPFVGMALSGLSFPAQLGWYLRESPGVTSFAIFPWSAFLLGGAAAGLCIPTSDDRVAVRRSNLALAMAGGGLVAVAMLYSWLGGWAGSPRWEDSPGGFLWRFGTVLAAVPVAHVCWSHWRGPEWLRELGVASLFVYWIHVELAYGVLSTPLHKSLSFEGAVLACVVFGSLVLGLVRLKSRLVPRVEFFSVTKYLRREQVTGL